MANSYLIGLTIDHANEINSRIMRSKQEPGNIDELVTKQWYAMLKHPEREEWAIRVHNGDFRNFTVNEMLQLKSEEEVTGDGWFDENDK